MQRKLLHRIRLIPLEYKKKLGTRIFQRIKTNNEERIRKKCDEIRIFLDELRPWVKFIEKEYPGSHLHHMAVNHRAALETLFSVLQQSNCPESLKQINQLDRCLKAAQIYMKLNKVFPEFMKKETEDEDGYYPDIKGTGIFGSTCLHYSLEAANRMGMR